MTNSVLLLIFSLTDGTLRSPQPSRLCGFAQLRPTHSVRPAQLNRGPRISRASTHLASRALIAQPAHFAWTRALCVGSHTLQPAHLAAHAMLFFPCNPFNLRSTIQANHAQYCLKTMPFFNLRSESEPPP